MWEVAVGERQRRATPGAEREADIITLDELKAGIGPSIHQLQCRVC